MKSHSEILIPHHSEHLWRYTPWKRVHPTEPHDVPESKQMSITDLDRQYEIQEIVKGDSIFCATGITTGDLIKGVKKAGNTFETETIVTHKSQNLVNKKQKKYISE